MFVHAVILKKESKTAKMDVTVMGGWLYGADVWSGGPARQEKKQILGIKRKSWGLTRKSEMVSVLKRETAIRYHSRFFAAFLSFTVQEGLLLVPNFSDGSDISFLLIINQIAF